MRKAKVPNLLERKRKITLKKLVITGGPCGAKSEVLKAIMQHFTGQVIVVPEAATQLLETPMAEGGPGVPGKDLDWSQEWQSIFQTMIVERQLANEAKAEAEASQLEGIEFIVCDRGILDGAAYLPGGTAEFCERFATTLEEYLGQYDHILHLNSLATDRPEEYDRLKATNPSRFEDSDTARELDQKLIAAWSGHRNHTVVRTTETLQQKVEFCLAHLSQIMEETR